MESKIAVEGIILVLSCQKHMNTRLKEFRLPRNEYQGWKVIYVIGDFFLDEPYKLKGNLLIVKTEDSYIHLLKKLVLTIRYLYEIYHIKQGVLRSGDDLVYNEHVLNAFLGLPEKPDYYGYSCKHVSYNPRLLRDTINDNFMLQYYSTHPEDFENPQHNLRGVDIGKYTKRPHVPIMAGGVLYYISNKSCLALVDNMKRINWDIFHFDTTTRSYPYTIEDCGVAFILYSNGIGFKHTDNMYSDHMSNNVIAMHTNKYR
jgi:hypothetical protein